MRAFEIAETLAPNCFADCDNLRNHPVLSLSAAQLYKSVISISANISEGYSRASGRDRARFFEYALGSVREAMAWYRAARPALGTLLAEDRLDTLEEIRRILLAIIPRERGRSIHKQP